MPQPGSAAPMPKRLYKTYNNKKIHLPFPR